MGKIVTWAKRHLNLMIKPMSRLKDTSDFVVLPRRWVVEKSLAWMTHTRRHARHCELLIQHSETMIAPGCHHPHDQASRTERLDPRPAEESGCCRRLTAQECLALSHDLRSDPHSDSPSSAGGLLVQPVLDCVQDCVLVTGNRVGFLDDFLVRRSRPASGAACAVRVLDFGEDE
ncbi:hypothetical protein GCM10010433_27050 [Streptomyces pulveraceus]